MMLPPNVIIPSVSPDNLYFLNGVGHVWQINLINNSSFVLISLGGYKYNEFRKRLLSIYPNIDIDTFWAPREFLDLIIWCSKDPWSVPEIKTKDGQKRIRVKWNTKIRICGPQYMPDPKLDNSIYCRPGNLDQAWDEILIRTNSSGIHFLNIENIFPFLYPDSLWGGIWYKLEFL
ncbi:MAG: hypothetical protein NZZ41_00440 [Candidatus Dojkabacteria bacterium]|nr:hypothetical protein [Candidatus Dojkabacteria bacterium]